MATTLHLILDAPSQDFTFIGPLNFSWAPHPAPRWYGGILMAPEGTNATLSASFEVSFEGTSITFTGNTPDPTGPQSIMVSIDDGIPYQTSYMDPTPQTYVQWYQSPTLSDDKHTIRVASIFGASLDYATITVGQNTPLSGKKIIVDDDDSAVHYSGNWTRNKDFFFPGMGSSKGLPFRNSTHRSTTPGDTVTFLFSGTTVAVYGIFEWQKLGTLAATYTIDGGTPIVGVYPPTPVNRDNGWQQNSNFPLFLLDSLPAGDHTLVINITQCLNLTFIFDYIIYTPSFSNLASMPSLVFTAPASTSSESSHHSSVPVHKSADSKHTPVGAIVGGAVGGLIVLVFVPLLVLWLRRRKGKKNPVSPFDLSIKEKLGDSRIPAQSEGQTVSNAIFSSSDSAAISPFQNQASRTQEYGLSAAVDREKSNDNLSGATSGGPSSTNLTRSISPANDQFSGVLTSPPAYEANAARSSWL